MSKWFKIGKYEQKVTKNDITCTCRFSSIYPKNYKEGKNLCKHIKEVIKILNGTTRNNGRVKK